MQYYRKVGQLLCFTAGFVLSFCIASSTTFADDVSARSVLAIGKITSNPKKYFSTLKPMVDYVAEHMRDLGIRDTNVVMFKDLDQLKEALRTGKVDWVSETAFYAVRLHDEAGAEFLARRWKQGSPRYQTIFFTRKDSGVNSLQDLYGKTIAFEELRSTSAFLVPVTTMLRLGLPVASLNSPHESAPHGKIGYVFSGEEINTSTWVYSGLVTAGVFSDLDWDDETHMPEKFKSQLKIFHRSSMFPRSIELVRADLPEVIKTRLKETLLQAHLDSEAQSVLHAYEHTSQFDDIDSETVVELNEARELNKVVLQELPK